VSTKSCDADYVRRTGIGTGTGNGEKTPAGGVKGPAGVERQSSAPRKVIVRRANRRVRKREMRLAASVITSSNPMRVLSLQRISILSRGISRSLGWTCL
jgi:hypothetical protein